METDLLSVFLVAILFFVLWLYHRIKVQNEYYKANFVSSQETLNAYKNTGIFWEQDLGNGTYLVMSHVGKYLKIIHYDQNGNTRVIHQEEFPQDFFLKFLEELEKNGLTKLSPDSRVTIGDMKSQVLKSLGNKQVTYTKEELQQKFDEGFKKGFAKGENVYASKLADLLLEKENKENVNDKELPEHVKDKQSRNENPKRITFTGR